MMSGGDDHVATTLTSQEKDLSMSPKRKRIDLSDTKKAQASQMRCTLEHVYG